MAQIIAPPDWIGDQDEITEFYNVPPSDDVRVVCDAEWTFLLLPTEVLVDFGIVSVSPDPTPYGITVSGGNYSGQFDRYFEQNGVSLPLRVRSRTYPYPITSVNGFMNLPQPPSENDIVEFTPPPEQKQTFTITVTLNYIDISVPLLPVPGFVTETFTQDLSGSYQSWGDSLSEYIIESGPFPRVG